MVDVSGPNLLNLHHFKGPDNLPANAVCVDRSSGYGNPYSLKSGLYTREECVARHRVDLYHRLITDASYFSKVKQDLQDKDLACWCAQPNKIVSCHGDNYLHILSEKCLQRDYKNGVVPYLMEDLRFVLTDLNTRINTDTVDPEFLFLYIHFGDVRVALDDVLRLCRDKYVDPDDLCVFLSTVVIDLELAYRDPDLTMIHYRFDHALWLIQRFIAHRSDRDHEPMSPLLSLKRKSKG